MRKFGTALAFMLVVAGATAFVWLTSLGLPNLVASHFGASGEANGFMPRSFYVLFMLGFVIGVPVLLVLVTSFAMGHPKARINLPNREYWLAPERRAETVAVLRAGVRWFGGLLVLFLCYAHWLVVRANQSAPARLAESWFIGGLVAFLVATLVGVWLLVGRFRRRGAPNRSFKRTA
jgi:uncharacterized membrane protein